MSPCLTPECVETVDRLSHEIGETNVMIRIQMIKAESVFYLEDYEEAERLFRRIEVHHLRFDDSLPGHELKGLKYRCYLKLGQICLWRQDLDGAEDNLLRAKEELSDDYRVFKYLGEACSRKNNYQQAIKYFEESQEIEDDGEVREELTVCEFKTANFNRCIEIADEPDEEDEHDNLYLDTYKIMALARLNRLEDALKFLNEIMVGREADLNLNILKAYLLDRLQFDQNDQVYLQKAETLLGDNVLENEQVEEFYNELKRSIAERQEHAKLQLDEELDKMEEGFKIEQDKDSFMKFSGEPQEGNAKQSAGSNSGEVGFLNDGPGEKRDQEGEDRGNKQPSFYKTGNTDFSVFSK